MVRIARPTPRPRRRRRPGRPPLDLRRRPARHRHPAPREPGEPGRVRLHALSPQVDQPDVGPRRRPHGHRGRRRRRDGQPRRYRLPPTRSLRGATRPCRHRPSERRGVRRGQLPPRHQPSRRPPAPHPQSHRQPGPRTRRPVLGDRLRTRLPVELRHQPRLRVRLAIRAGRPARHPLHAHRAGHLRRRWHPRGGPEGVLAAPRRDRRLHGRARHDLPPGGRVRQPPDPQDQGPRSRRARPTSRVVPSASRGSASTCRP